MDPWGNFGNCVSLLTQPPSMLNDQENPNFARNARTHAKTCAAARHPAGRPGFLASLGATRASLPPL